MGKRGAVNIVVLIGVVALVGVIGYFGLSGRTKAPVITDISVTQFPGQTNKTYELPTRAAPSLFDSGLADITVLSKTAEGKWAVKIDAMVDYIRDPHATYPALKSGDGVVLNELQIQSFGGGVGQGVSAGTALPDPSAPQPTAGSRYRTQLFYCTTKTGAQCPKGEGWWGYIYMTETSMKNGAQYWPDDPPPNIFPATNAKPQ